MGMINVKFLNPFLAAVSNILTIEAGIKAERGGNLKLAHDGYVTDDITVLVSLIGQVRGVVIFGMSEKTALSIVARILGQPFDEFDDLACSGISELGNVITGQASTGLGTVGYKVDISVPTVLRGRGTLISTLDIDRVVVPIKTDIGPMQIDLALREA
jgi:chemotaxis protein CheX